MKWTGNLKPLPWLIPLDFYKHDAYGATVDAHGKILERYYKTRHPFGMPHFFWYSGRKKLAKMKKIP